MKARLTLPEAKVPGYPGEWRRSTRSSRAVFHAIGSPTGESLCGGVTLDKNRSKQPKAGDVGYFGACERCARKVESA